MRRFLASALVCAAVSGAACAAPAPPVIEFFGAVRLDVAPDVELPVGGLSGLTYDGARDLWIAVSDDLRRVRLFEIRIEFSPGPDGARHWLSGAQVERAWEIDTPAVDAEAVTLHPGGDRLAIATEHPPALFTVARTPPGGDAPAGAFTSVDVPVEVLAAARANLSFESAAYRRAPGGEPELWLATESALTIDGEEASPERGASCRVLVFDGEPPHALRRQFIYTTDAAPHGVMGTKSRIGLVDLEALPDGRMLALERSLSLPRAFDATLFVVDPPAPGALRVNVDGAPAELEKTRLVSLSKLGMRIIPNKEGMALGPPAGDGRGGRVLLLISDDNFGRGMPAVTMVTALRLLEGSPD